MKKYLIVLLLVSIVVPPSFVCADSKSSDPEFLSLTRRPTPVSHLPSNISVVTAEQIKEMDAKTLDQVLDQLPSINLNRTGALGSFTSVRMRGAPTSAQVQIIIDDQPYGGISADQLVDVSQISVDNIERIEVVRGGSSVLFGANTTAGVIHVITKKHLDKKVNVSAGYERGSLNTTVGRVEAGFQGDKNDVLANATRFTTDGFQHHSDSENKYGSLVLGHSFQNGGRLSLNVANSNTSVGVPQGTAVPIGGWDGEKERVAANPTNRTDQRRLEGRARISEPLGGFGSVESVFFGSNSNYRNHDGSGPFDTPYEKNSHVFGNDTRLLMNHGTTLGFSYERDEFKDTSLSLIHINNVGGYVQQEFNWESGSFIPALRYDQHSNFGSEYCPRFTLVEWLTNFWAISGNISRSYRAPSFFDLYFDYAPTNFKSNRNLKPESAWTYDLGTEFKFSNHTDIKLTGYYTKMKDRIAHVDPDSDGSMNDTNANVAKAEMAGAEFEFTGQYGSFFHRGNYTYQRANQNSVSNSEYVPIALTPNHLANYTAGIKTKWGFTHTQTFQFVSKQYQFDAKQGGVLPSFGLWHLRFAQKIKFFELFAGINNILDRNYAQAFDFDTVNFVDTIDPLPGRTYYGGLNMEFGSAER